MYKVNLRGCRPSYYDNKRDALSVYNKLFVSFRGMLTVQRITEKRFQKDLSRRIG